MFVCFLNKKNPAVSFSYAQSWQESLKRLQANSGGGIHPSTEISLMIAPPSSVKSESPPPNAGDTRLSLGDRDLSPSAEESGALNLTKGSAAAGKGWSPPSPPGPGTPSSGQANHHIATPKSPQGYRPASYNSSDLCVVCGDRASGKKKLN